MDVCLLALNKYVCAGPQRTNGSKGRANRVTKIGKDFDLWRFLQILGLFLEIFEITMIFLQKLLKFDKFRVF